MADYIKGFICSTSRYEFRGWWFEYGYCGPWPLRKDGELRKRAGAKFWDIIKEFDDLPEAKKERCREGGGCVRF